MLAPVPDMERLDVVDKGWVLHHDFPGEWPTFIGWRTWDREPRNHENRERVDSVTVQRWANDGYASQISFWQDQCMLWPASTKTPVHAPGPAGPRVISPTEMEKAMGFPAGWAQPEAGFRIPEAKEPRPQQTLENLRRNAIGNAIALPQLSRLVRAALDTI